MKKIYETVADMVFPGMIFTGLMVVFVGVSLFGNLGKRMKAEKEDFSHMADSLAMEVVCNRKEPVIQCIGEKVWRIEETVDISEVFLAKDEEGTCLKIKVLDIKDQDGNNAMDCYHKEKQQAVFSQRGIYTFSLEAMDRERKIGKKHISIVVDDR